MTTDNAPATPDQSVDPSLTDEQNARVAALRAARACLVSRAAFSQGAADPVDLVSVARYIETGSDPWAAKEN